MDQTTGLSWYASRAYDPALARFLQPDSKDPWIRPARNSSKRSRSLLPSAPASPQLLNRYSYVLNNPVRYNDPTGYIPESEAGPQDAGNSGWASGDFSLPNVLDGAAYQQVVASYPSFAGSVPPESSVLQAIQIDADDLAKEHAHQKFVFTVYGVTVVNNDTGGTAEIIGGPKNSITLSSTLIDSGDDLFYRTDILRHELGHTIQAAHFGEGYLTTYVAYNVATYRALVQDSAYRNFQLGYTPDKETVHRFHPMEIDANRRVGYDPYWSPPQAYTSPNVAAVAPPPPTGAPDKAISSATDGS